MYAIHLFDLQGWLTNWPVMTLLRPVLSERTVDLPGGQIAGVAMVLDCDDERGAAIVALLRMKVPRDRLRMYQSRNGRNGWKAV